MAIAFTARSRRRRMGNCKKIKKTINGNDFTYKCIKFYVYKMKPETLKFVVVFCLFVCLFSFCLLLLLLLLLLLFLSNFKLYLAGNNLLSFK